MSFIGGFGPGNIDCDEVLKDLYLYLDGETGDEVKNRIQQHLDACSPCLKQYGLEQDVRSLVARCCGSDQAPQSLHDRVKVRITEVSLEIARVEYRAE